jgi:hypothetical protein
MGVCMVSIGQLNAQEPTKDSPVKPPLNESNGTKPATDQNKTAPATPPAVPAPTDTQPAPPPGSAAEGVPKPSEKPKATEPMPEPLGGVDFGDFIRRNPFNLERPSDKPPAKKPEYKPAPPARPTVRLSGMTAFRGNKKVLLEIRVPGAGATPLYHALAESESANGVKVLSIDPEKGEVRLDITGEESTRSFDEGEGKGEIESMAGGRSSTRGSSTRGSSTRGSSTRGSSTRGSFYNRRPTTPTRPPAGGGGKLKPVPQRSPGKRSDLNPYKEPPVFDKVVQTELIVATQINTHREFPRGVVAAEPPTDLPFNRR